MPCGAVGPGGRDHCAKKSHRVAKRRPHSPAQDLCRIVWGDGMICQGLLSPPRKQWVGHIYVDSQIFISSFCVFSHPCCKK